MAKFIPVAPTAAMRMEKEQGTRIVVVVVVVVEYKTKLYNPSLAMKKRGAEQRRAQRDCRK